MKHLLTTALLCGASILGTQAQNVIIFDKDGVQHKFNADYVQEITFEQVQSGDGYDFKFENLSVNPWNSSNINLEFKSGDNVVSLDIYQPKTFYLVPGEYTVASNYSDFTIDPGYSEITLNGSKPGLQSGKMTIAQNGDSYSFDMNFVLTSGEELKGTYTGELNAFGPSINFNLSGCVYAKMNEPAPNGFYYNFNDKDYKLEMRIELYSAGNAPAPGVYTFSDSMEDNTASSYVHLYSPYNEVTEFTEGTVTVSGEGNDTVVEIDGMLDLGIRMTAKFKGALPERE